MIWENIPKAIIVTIGLLRSSHIGTFFSNISMSLYGEVVHWKQHASNNASCSASCKQLNGRSHWSDQLHCSSLVGQGQPAAAQSPAGPASTLIDDVNRNPNSVQVHAILSDT